MNEHFGGLGRGAILDGAKRAFFKAMLNGYAEGEKDPALRVLREDTTFTRKVNIEVGDYIIVDQWEVTHASDCSGGRTVIFFKGEPVWQMFYLGSYPKEVIPLLKEALALAYREQVFNGGRGPREYRTSSGHKLYWYLNTVEGAGFSSFHGHEKIVDAESGSVLGYHDYRGKAMI